MGVELVEPLLPRAQQRFFCRGLHRASVRVGDEIAWFDHAGVDGGDDDAISNDRAERFHEVERQRGPAMARAVIESPPRIESLAPQGDEAFFDQKCVGEREQRVDRVFGWTPVAGGEIEIGQLAGFQHAGKGGEVVRGGLAFPTAQDVRWNRTGV